jgi:hypothetical protein
MFHSYYSLFNSQWLNCIIIFNKCRRHLNMHEFIEFSFEKALKKVKIFRIDLRNEIFSDSSSKLAAMLVDGETFFYGMRLMRNLTIS